MLILANAKHMPLATCFAWSVRGHANMFQSCGESKRNMDYSQISLDSDDLLQIKHAYAFLYPTFWENIQMPLTCKKCSYIGNKLTSASEIGNVPYSLTTPLVQGGVPEPRPVHVLYFVQHSWITQSGQDSSHFTGTLAVCEWPQQHPNCHVMGKPFEGAGMNRFVPIEHRVIITVECIERENNIPLLY